MKKQILVGALSLSMLITPAMPVWAAEALDEQTNAAIVADGDDVQANNNKLQASVSENNSETDQATSGSCGAEEHESDVTWQLEENGEDTYTLTISGNGAMADYDSAPSESNTDAKQGWSKYYDKITRVVVENGITRIGDSALGGLLNVEEYSFGKDVAEIGNWGIKVNSAKRFIVDEDSDNLKVVDNVLFSKDGKILYAYPGGADTVDTYTTPAGTEEIREMAFAGCDAKKVIFSDGVKVITQGTFGRATTEELVIPDTVTDVKGASQTKKITLLAETIDPDTYSSFSAMEELYLPNATAFPANFFEKKQTGKIKKVDMPNVTEIGDKGFYYCNALETVNMPKVEKIGATAFENCQALQELTLPNTLKEIGNNAFRGTGLTHLVLPDSVKTIDGSAFANCKALESISYGQGLEKIGVNAFSGDSAIKAIDASKLTTLKANDYWDSNLAYGYLFGSVNSDSTFTVSSNFIAYMDKTGYATLLKNKFGDSAIYAVTNGGTFKTAPTSNTELAEPEKIGSKFLGWYTDDKCTEGNEFSGTPVLGQTYYAKWSATEANFVAGGYCGEDLSWKLYKNNDDATNQTYKLVIEGTGDMYDYAASTSSGTVAPWRLNPKQMCDNITEISLPEGITHIGSNAFLKTNVTEFNIPESVTSLGDNAMWNNAKPLTINISENVRELGTTAIFGKFKLNVNGENPYFTTTEGGKMLYNKDMTKLIQVSQDYETDNLVIPDTVTEIGDFAMHGCELITGAVTVPASVKTIGNEGFYNTKITALTLNEGLETIGTNAFNRVVNAENPTTLTGELVIPSTVTDLHDSSFGNTGFTKITYKAETVPANFMKKNATVKEVVFSDKAKDIEHDAFNGCTALESVTFGDTVETIGNLAFANCTALKEVNLTESIKKVGYAAFSYNTHVEKVAVPLADITYGSAENEHSHYIFTIYNNNGADPQLKTIILGSTPDSIQVSELFGQSTANLETLVLGTGVTAQDALDLGKIKQGLYPSTLDVSASSSFKNVATKYTLVNSTMAHGNQAAMLTLEKPESGADVSSHISYTSSDESILAVDKNGTITAVGNSGSKATVAAFYDGCKFAELEITIGKADSSTEITADNLTATYGDTITLTATVAKSPIRTRSADADKVEFKCGDTVLGTADVTYSAADKTAGTATLNYDTKNGGLKAGAENTVTANYGGSVNLNGSDSNSIKVTLNKADIANTAPTAKSGLVYNTEAQELIVAGTVETEGFNWQYKVGEGAYSAELPKATNAGTYPVYAKIDGNENYNAVAEKLIGNVEIAKAQGAGTVEISGWTYGDPANKPTVASATNGIENVTCKYKVTGKDDSTYTTTVPVAAGDYTVQATFAETDNYLAAVATADFNIAKADPEYTVPTDLKGYQNRTLSTVTLPEGWSWKNSDEKMSKTGNQTFKATFTPADTDNYNIIEDIDVTVNVRSTALPGGSTQTEFGITAPKADNGSVGISQKEASAGTTITVSLTPAEGYKAGSLTVTDKNGNKLTLKSVGENKYTFTMPNSAVDVKANFVKADGTIDSKNAIVMQIGNKTVNSYGKEIKSDVAPLIINDRTMVPIRIVTETLGGTADWNAKTQVVTLNIDGKTITMQIGVVLEKYGVSPIIINNRTYVPIRFVAEELGASVDWNADMQQIVITK